MTPVLAEVCTDCQLRALRQEIADLRAQLEQANAAAQAASAMFFSLAARVQALEQRDNGDAAEEEVA